MRYKVNTIIVFTPTILKIIAAWEQACKEVIPNDYEPTFTGGLDGTHARLSKHYSSNAADFRKRDIKPSLHKPLSKKAQEILGPQFRVLIESTHFHIQRRKA